RRRVPAAAPGGGAGQVPRRRPDGRPGAADRLGHRRPPARRRERMTATTHRIQPAPEPAAPTPGPATPAAPAAPRLPQLGDWRNARELARLQDEQLAATLEWAARSPFYRDGGPVPADRAGFDALPLTTKQDLREQYPFGMLAVDRARLATYHESSGTAGRPTPSYYTAEDWVDLAERFARKWVGIEPADT